MDYRSRYLIQILVTFKMEEYCESLFANLNH
jgi:hypothetical protein